jgi:hypothetical protein
MKAGAQGASRPDRHLIGLIRLIRPATAAGRPVISHPLKAAER